MMHSQDSTNTASETLDQCLRAIESGEATIGSCVAQFPDHPELVQLLSTITIVQDLPRPVLSQTDKALMRQQVLAKYRSQQTTLKPVQKDTAYHFPRWTELTVALGIAIVIFFYLQRHRPGIRYRLGDSGQRRRRS